VAHTGSHQISQFKCFKGASNANYLRQLLKTIGKVDGLVTGDEEVRELMLDRPGRESSGSFLAKQDQDDSSCE
jgi:hypothetical protein